MPKGEAHPAYHNGKYSKETVNRDALIVRLMNTPVVKKGQRKNLLDAIYDVFAEAIARGDQRAAKDLFEQCAGGPRQTVEHVMSDDYILAVVGRVAIQEEGKPLNAEAFMEKIASELRESR